MQAHLKIISINITAAQRCDKNYNHNLRETLNNCMEIQRIIRYHFTENMNPRLFWGIERLLLIIDSFIQSKIFSTPLSTHRLIRWSQKFITAFLCSVKAEIAWKVNKIMWSGWAIILNRVRKSELCQMLWRNSLCAYIFRYVMCKTLEARLVDSCLIKEKQENTLFFI